MVVGSDLALRGAFLEHAALERGLTQVIKSSAATFV